MGLKNALLLLAAPFVLAQQTQPAGTPFPETTYPNATDPAAAAGAKSGQTSPPYYPSPWGEGAGDWAAAYAKARQFVSQLTLTEKVNLTTGVGWQGDQCVGNAGQIPRLNFRGFCLQDSPLGVRFGDFASAFSAGVTAAATWDRALIRQRGADMGAEHRGKGVDMQLGPVVGPLGRSPEGGRNWEGFSPDPVLSGIAVYETVQGIQSSNVIACTKHYILNEQEHYRSTETTAPTEAISSNIDDTTMHELYLWPFADAVRAGTAAIMCSYNQINNSYGCQNSDTLNKLLKSELGFQGVVVSDWSAQHSGVSSALAGLDMTMPGDIGFDSGTSFWGANLTIAVLNGTVPQWRLDDMAVRIMASYYYVGRDTVDVEPNFSSWFTSTNGYRFFHSNTGYGAVNKHVNVQADHKDNIREVAAKGAVLLKNSGALPLNAPNVKLTGVFGADAGPNFQGPNGCSDRGCDQGTLAMGWGSGTANFPYLVTPAEAIELQARNANADVESIFDNNATALIANLAGRVDDVNGAAIVFANADAGEGYITVDNNAGDRNNLTLWGNGEALINLVASNCKNTIVVLHTVGPVLVSSWYNNPNITAIVWAGVPGQESGNALVDVLYGSVNPSGKLPFTLGSSRGEYGTDLLYVPNNGDNAPQDNFLEGVFIDYRVFDKLNVTPVYEFGFGLSYTTFEYSNIQISAGNAAPYQPTSGNTPSAPIYGTIDNTTSNYVFPSGFNQLQQYIYSYLNSSTLSAASGDPLYGINYDFPADAYNSAPQPRLPASGPSGGNAGLYEVLFTVTATVTNTGSVAGEEVAQLYVSLGGNNPKVVLRNFDKKLIQPGASATFSFDLTRKDLSNWDTNAQDWYINSYSKTAYVGSSSRKLPLSVPIPVQPSGSYPPYPSSSVSYTTSASGKPYPSSSAPASTGPATGSTLSTYGPPPVSSTGKPYPSSSVPMSTGPATGSTLSTYGPPPVSSSSYSAPPASVSATASSPCTTSTKLMTYGPLPTTLTSYVRV
ncbi:glycoside hydrolase family 3 protein [Myriangium duriaei CBS 260.36]|uniref:beta-glucosidase n=1 Tax=Myriangium duriaei CBS 260.36 TaxID=1168546 RepID=A0A9P4MFC1_9PEZI|nr:glycoside hydrolase family 3 protein [Myriangium duriaei CBS 260.36]